MSRTRRNMAFGPGFVYYHDVPHECHRVATRRPSAQHRTPLSAFGLSTSRAPWLLLWVSCALVAVTSPTDAQETSGSTGLAVVGGALGATSGAVLGAMGSIPPCWQTAAGLTCVRWGVGVGMAAGLVSGVVIGASNPDHLADAGTSAAIGAGVGLAVGFALTPIAQRFTWRDVLAVGVMGGAIGSAPAGSAIGFAAGAVVGGVLWQTVHDVTLPDAVGAGIVGMSLGALAEWVIAAANASANGTAAPGAQIVLPLSVRF